MQVIREADNYISSGKPLFLALGNFDGVHQGHKKLITTLLNRARQDDGTAAAFIFEPHPSKVLFPERAPKMLVTAEQKVELLKNLGMDLLIYHSFSLEMARWTPEEFVKRVLVDLLHIKEAFIGFNYSFGHRGAGTPEMLQALGEGYGFKVHIISPVRVEDEVVSSTLIRRYLEQGVIDKAKEMLCHYPFLEGRVVKGDRRGAAILGFPTANLQVDEDVIVPGKGVYAARVRRKGEWLPAVVNIGNVPTFLSGDAISIEAHLIDFQGDLYGESLGLSFYKKLRDERKFGSIEELKAQIGADRDAARDYLPGQPLPGL
ncbi:MAG: bifunctional riboflavin kinase/FAD synthetase [Syntrophomonadaceae bacterium]